MLMLLLLVSYCFPNNGHCLMVTVGSALPSMVSGRGIGVSPKSVVHLLTIQTCSSSSFDIGKHIPEVYCILCFQATSHMS